VADLAERLFEGDITQMVCHLLEGRPITREELAELKRLIREKERQLGE
jgi:predicted transcriptional regulator